MNVEPHWNRLDGEDGRQDWMVRCVHEEEVETRFLPTQGWADSEGRHQEAVHRLHESLQSGLAGEQSCSGQTNPRAMDRCWGVSPNAPECPRTD